MPSFYPVFDRLRGMMLAASEGCVIAADEPGALVVRTAAIDPSTGEPGWFGTVTIKKRYVAYHLIPLYADPSLADALSPALARRRQGKTCFNFTKVDEGLFEELSALTQRAAWARDRG